MRQITYPTQTDSNNMNNMHVISRDRATGIKIFKELCRALKFIFKEIDNIAEGYWLLVLTNV